MKNDTEHILHLSESQLALIEKVGVHACGQGMQPAAARIASLLMVSDKLELTFDEIRATLMLSKSATSNGLNYLLLTNKIEFSTKTGDRKRYFKSNIHAWEATFTQQFHSIGEFAKLLTEIQLARTPDTPEFNKSIGEFSSFINFFIGEIPKLYEKWKIKTNQ